MVSLSRFIVACFLALSLTSSSASAQGFFEHPLKGKPAPDFTLDTVKAQKVNFKALSQGKKTIVFFWATWCPHCREQIKALNAKKGELDKAGVQVVYVDIGEDAGTVKTFLDRNGYDLDVFLDGNSYLSETYAVFGIPSLFFISADGTINEMLNVFPNDYMKLLN
jgi:cytochrome c biogenesis protein CcmG, thiol:disulfide interchange protein DsbE